MTRILLEYFKLLPHTEDGNINKGVFHGLGRIVLFKRKLITLL